MTSDAGLLLQWALDERLGLSVERVTRPAWPTPFAGSSGGASHRHLDELVGQEIALDRLLDLYSEVRSRA